MGNTGKRASQRRTQLNDLKTRAEGIAKATAFSKAVAAETAFNAAVIMIAGLVDDIETLEGVTYGG